jgi:hypothetical protein
MKTLLAYTDPATREYPGYVNISKDDSGNIIVSVREVANPSKGLPGKDVFKVIPSSELQQMSDGFHTFAELYDHRIMLFLAMMNMANSAGLECGWSKRHDDGELCFGGGWVIGWITAQNGKQVRYHMEDTRPLPPLLEKAIAPKWNGVEETLDALGFLASA